MKGLIFTYALTYGGAIVSLFNPFYGLLIYVCFAIVKPTALWHWSVPAGNYSRIIAIALLVGWIIHGFGRWNFGRARLIVFALLGFWVWVFLTALQAPYPAISLSQVEALSKIYLPFLVGITLISNMRQVQSLAWCIVLSEGYLAFEFNMTYLVGHFNPNFFKFGGLDNNGIGITMCASIGLAFFLAMESPKLWQRALAAACAVLMAHFIMFSMSRGAMVALGITMFTSFLLLPKTLQRYAQFVIALIIVGILAGPSVRNEFLTVFADEEKRDISTSSRLDNWAICWEMMLRHPLLGVGLDHYPIVVEDYAALAGKQTSQLVRKGREAHTLWLQLGAELGFPGLGLLVTFYGACVMRLRSMLRNSALLADPWAAALGRAVIAGIISFAVAAQFVTIEGIEIPYYVVLVGAAVLKVNSMQQNTENRSSPRPVSRAKAPVASGMRSRV